MNGKEHGVSVKTQVIEKTTVSFEFEVTSIDKHTVTVKFGDQHRTLSKGDRLRFDLPLDEVVR